MNMRRFVITILLAAVSSAQITIPEGTKIRLHLEQNLSSGTAEEGQTVELTVAEAVHVNGAVVIRDGARATGTVTQAVGKRRMGRAGKLDFSIDRVSAADGQWVPLRYTVHKKSGDSHSVRTGIITAGVAVAFWPAAPAVLLLRGKDIVINKGTPFEVFTDSTHAVGQTGPAPAGTLLSPPMDPVLPVVQPALAPPPVATALPASVLFATVTVTSPVADAEIEVDGQFVGSTPTMLRLPAGTHQINVKSGVLSYQRTLQVTAGSSVSLKAALSRAGGSGR